MTSLTSQQRSVKYAIDSTLLPVASEVFKLIGQWMEQDAILAKSFYESLDPNGQLAKNLNILSGGASQ